MTPLHCAWCVSESGDVPIAGVSHGICERHAEELQREAREFVRIELRRPVAIENVERDRSVRERGGKRTEQVAFSGAIVLLALVASVLLGVTVAIFEAFGR